MVLKYQFQTLLTLRAPEIILLPPSPCTVVIWNYDVIIIVVLKCRPSGCLDVSPVSLKIWMKMASLLLFEVNNWHILILTVVCVIYMWSETHISGLHDTTIEIEKFPIFLMSWKWSAFRVFLSRNSLKSLQPAPCLNFSFIWKKNISWWKKKKRLFSRSSSLRERRFLVIVPRSVLGCEVDCEWNTQIFFTVFCSYKRYMVSCASFFS